MDNYHRIDILCGFKWDPPIFPCEKCNSEKCEGRGDCKGYGAYLLGVYTSE